MTQIEKIVDALTRHREGLTTRDLSRISGSTNVTGRISEARKRGHNIINERNGIQRGKRKYNKWSMEA